MNIKLTNELGTIEIEDITFSELLREEIRNTNGRVHLASKAGKMLGGFDKKVTLGEAAQNMSISIVKSSAYSVSKPIAALYEKQEVNLSVKYETSTSVKPTEKTAGNFSCNLIHNCDNSDAESEKAPTAYELPTFVWKFYVIIDFGTSISEITCIILDNLVETLSKLLPEYNIDLSMIIVGVKSKQIAPRYLVINRKYEKII